MLVCTHMLAKEQPNPFLLSGTPERLLKPGFHLHIVFLVSSMVFKFLRKVLYFSSPHYITFQTFKNNNFKTGSWRCNLFAGLTTNKNEKVLENQAFHQAMENRWRSNHSNHSWKVFQTSCKGITWLNVVVSGCFFTLGRDVTRPGYTWTGKGI